MRISDWSSDVCSSDLLTAIIDNDTGDYTVNERRAALRQRDTLEKAVLTDLAKTPNLDEQLKNNSETIAGATDQQLARERSATRFVNGLDKTNPFAGLTREELNAVVYDETKSYTTNERRAAYAELKQYRSEEPPSELQSLMRTSYAV